MTTSDTAPVVTTCRSASVSKYALYTAAFQNVKADIAFLSDLFRREIGRMATSLREDFCGTAALSACWVKSDPDRTVVAIDNDSDPLTWSREHILNQLEPQERTRIQLVHSDVLDIAAPPASLIVALNGSFCVFKRRDQFKAYIELARNSLLDDGLLVLELYAGPEAQMIGVDRIPCNNFVAVWEQADFNAVTNEALNRIHFELADGSRIQNAFVYDWRLWSPAELTELLLECGFRHTCLYRKHNTDRGDSIVEPCTRADVRSYWEVYVVGFR